MFFYRMLGWPRGTHTREFLAGVTTCGRRRPTTPPGHLCGWPAFVWEVRQPTLHLNSTTWECGLAEPFALILLCCTSLRSPHLCLRAVCNLCPSCATQWMGCSSLGTLLAPWLCNFFVSYDFGLTYFFQRSLYQSWPCSELYIHAKDWILRLPVFALLVLPNFVSTCPESNSPALLAGNLLHVFLWRVQLAATLTGRISRLLSWAWRYPLHQGANFADLKLFWPARTPGHDRQVTTCAALYAQSASPRHGACLASRKSRQGPRGLTQLSETAKKSFWLQTSRLIWVFCFAAHQQTS